MHWKAIGEPFGWCDIDVIDTVSVSKSRTFVVKINEEKLGDIIFLKKM